MHLQKFVTRYFPQAINDFFTAHVYGHPLAKEITATVLCNIIIGQAGCTFLAWIEEVNNTVTTDLIAAYLLFDEILTGEKLRAQISALDNLISASEQYTLLLRLEDTLLSFCRWTLTQGRQRIPNEVTMSSLCYYLEQYEQHQEKALSSAENPSFLEQKTKLQEKGFTAELSQRMALLDRLADFPAVVDLAMVSGKEFSQVINTYESASNYLGYPEIQEMLNSIPVRDYWERKAQKVLNERFKAYLVSLTLEMLNTAEHNIIDFFIARKRQQRLLQYQNRRQEIKETSPTTLLPFTVLCGELEFLAQV